MNKIMNNGKFFAGLALGALVGSALSCFAHSIYDTIQDLEEDAYDFAHRAKHKAEKVSGEVVEKMSQQAEAVKGKLNEVTNK